jgi:type VI secretion system secreted protein Hcp
MRIRKQAALLGIAVIATAVVAVGVTTVFTAGASTGPTTYYGCLRSGKLIDVGVTAPTCPGSAGQISWNSQGSPGPTGPQGPVGEASVVNVPAASEFVNPCPEPPGPTGSGTGGVSAFLSIPGIPGESTDSNHTGQIDVLSWSLGLAGGAAGSSCVGSHSATGQGGASGQQLTIVKGIDKASPELMVSAGDGNHLGTIVLTVRKAGASQDYLTYTFSNAFVTGVQWLSGGNLPQEEVTFEYTQVKISYTQQNADGTFANPILSCFDINLQQSC